MRPNRIFLLSAIALAAVGLGAAGPASAHKPIQCGAVLTKSITLHKDLLACPGNGLVIGASGITVDLNGHRVEGTSFSDTSGIDNSGGYDHLRIVDGKIGHFLNGILLVSTRHSKVARNTVTNVDGSGIYLQRSSDNRLLDNNSSSFHAGMRLEESHRNLVRDNVLFGDPALNVTESNVNVIRDNTLSGVGGVVVNASNDNLFARNNLTSTRTFGGFGLSSGSGNELRRNTVSRSGEDGIVVGPAAQSTWLIRNTANDNARDGILVLSPSTVLRANSASRNSDLGIEAVDGVTDAGGNRASANGDPRQCVGVFCSPAN